MSKYTSGEWRYYTSPQPNGCPIVGAGGVMVAMLAHSVNEPGQVQEALANAQLISAAPDLLEALQLMVADFDGCYADGEPAIIKARAALVKATQP